MRSSIACCNSYEDLPDQLVSDIDIACYAEDLRSIRLLFLGLHLGEYQLIQYLEYAPCASYFVFARNDLRKSESVAIDVICAHTRGGLLLKQGRELLIDRRHIAGFWACSPAVELAYTLSKNVCKGNWSRSSGARMKRLISGMPGAAVETVGRTLFGAHSPETLKACSEGTLVLS